MTGEIELEDLQERLQAGTPTLLVEALPQRYFDDGHLPGAVRLDIDGVREQAARILPDRDAFIVVYCAGLTCRNSHQVAQRLSALGYEQVRVFAGGKEAWSAAGLLLEGQRVA